MHAWIVIIVLRVLLAQSGKSTVVFFPMLTYRAIQAGLVWAAFTVWQLEHSVALAALCLLLAFPSTFLDRLLVPAGIPKLTYPVARVVRPLPVVHESTGHAVLLELRTRLQRGRALGNRSRQELSDRLFSGSGRAVRGSTLTALATLLALDGEAEEARGLFAVTQALAGRHAFRSARAYSQAWLLVEAAERGAWNEVVRVSASGPKTLRAVFMRRCARRLLGLPTRGGKWPLGLLWLLAPGKLAARPLLARALASEPRATLVASGDDARAAVELTWRLLALPAGGARRSELREAALTWQRVLDGSELAQRLATRRDALDANFRVRDVLARLETELVGVFAGLWGATVDDGEPAGEEPSLIVAAKDALQHELLEEVESACSGLEQGDTRDREFLEDYWRRWARIRSHADRLIALLPERKASLWNTVGIDLLNHGAWLHNKVGAQVLAHDVFRWLLGVVPKGDMNYQLVKKNAGIGRGV